MCRIATLLTCHNRVAKTIACLSSLQAINFISDIYLVDDGSEDETSKIVNKLYPNVNIILGNGDLFWNRGMYTAWKEAIKYNYDYYLWLNDDVELYPIFFKELIECEKLGGGACIISGLIENFDKTKILYGGSDQDKNLIQANGKLQKIKYMNGNVVLVPKIVVNKIGILDPTFHHDLGDVDYGLNAWEHGIKIFSTRIPIAAGYSNNFCRVRKWNSNIIGRFKKLYSPLGSNPNLNFYYRKKHFGIINAVSYYIYLHLINILSDTVISWIWGNKYKDM